MHRPFRSLLACALLAAASSAWSLAEPLVLVPPVSTTAFSGDAVVTFHVVAGGDPAPTYQWQVNVSGTWSDLAEGAIHSGVTSPTLNIGAPGLAYDGHRYRCVLTQGGSSVPSPAATLRVFAAPSLEPEVALPTSSISSASSAPIAVNITGLPAGTTIDLECILDADGDGEPTPGEPSTLVARVTDGAINTIAGIAVPTMPRDDDGAADGAISTHFTLPSSPEVARTAGQHLVRVSSPAGLFRPVTRMLTVTQPAHAQSISGEVTSGGTPVPFSVVVLLAAEDDGRFVSAVVADASGAFTLQVPAAGAYMVFPVQPGQVGSFGEPTFVGAGETVTGLDLEMTPATRTISGTITREADETSTPIGGVQVFAASDSGAVLGFSDRDGRYVLGVTAGEWEVDPSEQSLARVGCLALAEDPFIDATAGSVTADADLPAATAVIYGTVSTNLGSPLAGVAFYASNGGGYASSAVTDATGHYVLLASGSTTPTLHTWWVGIDEEESTGLGGYIPPSGQSVDLSASQAFLLNLTVQAATAHLQGRVTLDGIPLPGVGLGASSTDGDGSTFISTTTDAEGNFDLGVVAGSWILMITADGAAEHHLVAPNVSATVADGQTLSGLTLAAISATGVITGSVRDADLSPLGNVFLYANAVIGGKTYFTSAVSDSLGLYSMPVINGTWWTGVSMFGTPPVPVTVTGPTTTKDFTRALIAGVSGNLTIAAGQSGAFVVVTAVPDQIEAYQWQVSTDAITWTDLPESSTYQGTTTSTLLVFSATPDLNGRLHRVRVTYNGANYFSTPMLLIVTGGAAGFDAWRETHFDSGDLADPDISGPTAAPAGDGVANLLKYAFGLDPWTPSADAVPAPTLADGVLTLEFDALRPELSYVVEASTDLQTWTTDGVELVTDGTQHTATYALAGRARAFLRIRVTEP